MCVFQSFCHNRAICCSLTNRFERERKHNDSFFKTFEKKLKENSERKKKKTNWRNCSSTDRTEKKKKTSDNQRHIKINLIIHVEMKTHIYTYTIKHLFTLDPLNRVDELFPNCFIDVLFTKLLCCWMELNEAYRERVSAHLAPLKMRSIWSRVHKHLGPPLLITITSIIAILASLFLFYFISFCFLSLSLFLSRPLHFIVIIII